MHRIKRFGLADAAAPHRCVRLRPAGSFFVVCHEGRGRVLLDGRWQSSSKGVAYLAPPRVLSAFHAVPGARCRASAPTG